MGSSVLSCEMRGRPRLPALSQRPGKEHSDVEQVVRRSVPLSAVGFPVTLPLEGGRLRSGGLSLCFPGRVRDLAPLLCVGLLQMRGYWEMVLRSFNHNCFYVYIFFILNLES